MRLISIHRSLVLGVFIVASRAAAAQLPDCDSNPLILDCFESYSVELRDAHLKQLDAIADDVKKRRSTGAAVHSITIRGHSATWRPTDPVEENARARANRAFHALWSRLVARKINADKIIFKVVGAADSEPRVSNSTEDGRALNRRVEIDLGGPGGAELAWLEDFHSCKTPYPPYPGTRWLDDPTLETVRNQKPDGRYGLLRGNDHAQANKLINTLLARWSCEVY